MRLPAACCLALASVAAVAVACSSSNPADPAHQDAVPDAAVASDAEPEASEPFDIDPSRIRADIAVLTSDAFEGRLPGSPGGEKAMEFVESHFGKLGLQPVTSTGFRMGFAFDQWVKSGPAILELAGSTLKEGTDHTLLQYSGSGSSNGDLAFVGFGLTIPPFDPALHPDCPFDPQTGYDDYAGVDVTGKTVVLFRHGPKDNLSIATSCPANEAAKGDGQLLYFGYKASNAKLHGARAALFVQDWSHDAAPMQGTVDAAYYDPSFPVFAVNRDKLIAAVPDMKSWVETINSTLAPHSVVTDVKVSLSAETAIENVQTANLVGAVQGTDPVIGSEVVVIGAHVDHLGKDPSTGEIFRGADDNASGTAVMMELARAVVLTGLKPARTLVFAGFNAEEVGLIGSCRYVEQPPWPLAKTVAMFSIDMVGAGDGSGLVLYGAKEASTEWIGQLMSASAAASALPFQVLPEAYVPNSDHACFAQAGVPAVLALSAGEHAFYHTPQDTLDTILDADLEASARLLWATLQPLAMGTEKRLSTP